MVSQSTWLAQMMMCLYPCPKLTHTNTTTCSMAIIAETYSQMELQMGLFGILSQVRYWIWVKAKCKPSIDNMLLIFFLCCLYTSELIFYNKKWKTKYRIINGLGIFLLVLSIIENQWSTWGELLSTIYHFFPKETWTIINMIINTILDKQWMNSLLRGIFSVRRFSQSLTRKEKFLFMIFKAIECDVIKCTLLIHIYLNY